MNKELQNLHNKLQKLHDDHTKDQEMFDSLKTTSQRNAKFSFIHTGLPVARLHDELFKDENARNIRENLAMQNTEIESVKNKLLTLESKLTHDFGNKEIYNEINTTIQALIL